MSQDTTSRRSVLRRLGIAGTVAVAGTGVASAHDAPASLTFSDQAPKGNRMVFVDEAHLPDWGFVVVHHLVDHPDDTGDEPDGAVNFQVIGHTPALPAGTHRNVPIRLHDDTHHTLGGPVPDAGSGDHVLLSMAHMDDPNDHTYTFTGGDPPFTDANGVVVDPAIVTF